MREATREELLERLEKAEAELSAWNAISESCGRTRAEIYGMSHQLKAGKYASKPQPIPSCDCSNPDNLKIHDEICDILEGNAWNENEVCTASVGIWAALKWYERERELTESLKAHAEKLANIVSQIQSKDTEYSQDEANSLLSEMQSSLAAYRRDYPAKEFSESQRIKEEK